MWIINDNMACCHSVTLRSAGAVGVMSKMISIFANDLFPSLQDVQLIYIQLMLRSLVKGQCCIRRTSDLLYQFALFHP